MAKIYLILFASAFVLSYLITHLMIFIAPKLGFVDKPGERKIHVNSKPYGGGIAIFITIYSILLCIGFLLFFYQEEYLPVEFKTHYRGLTNTKVLLQLLGLLIAGSIIFLVGLIDDIRLVSPKLKMITFIIAGLVVAASGTKISAFISWEPVNYLVTIFWIVAITNSFNLLDNMDGLSSGVALISSLTLVVISLMAGELFISALLILFIGAIAGFWVMNYTPARIFLGDSGSLLIGFFVSIFAILPTYYKGSENSYAMMVFTPLLLLAVPIFDTATVIYIRLKLKKPIYVGDNNHFSHRLTKLGLSRHQAVLVIYLVCIIIGISVILMSLQNIFGACLLFVQAILTFLLILILENAGRKK